VRGVSGLILDQRRHVSLIPCVLPSFLSFRFHFYIHLSCRKNVLLFLLSVLLSYCKSKFGQIVRNTENGNFRTPYF
jgi:hypothetical protein